MMGSVMPRKLPALFFLGLIVSTNLHAALILSAPPREDAAKGKELYEPLADLLSNVTGEKVEYVHPKGWLDYSTEMRAGKYDIVFDGPHFSAWRIAHLDHQPVARLPGTLDFVVIAYKDNKKMRNHHSVGRGTLCGMASPNLGTVSVLAEFQDSIVSPKVIEVKGGFKKVYLAFKEGKCDVAVLRDNVWNKFVSKEDKRQLRVLYKIKPLPNQTITVGPRIKQKARLAIATALQSKDGAKAGDKILERFSKTAKQFVKCDVAEYTDLEKLLEGVVFGW